MTYDVRNPLPDDSVGRYILALHEHNKLQGQRPLACDKISIQKRKLASMELGVCYEDAKPLLTNQIKDDIYRLMYDFYPQSYTPITNDDNRRYRDGQYNYLFDPNSFFNRLKF
jgi:hypothetical protein